MNFDPVIGVLQVFFAVLIAFVPLFYPRHSCYYKRASNGIEQLKTDADSVIVSDGEEASSYELDGVYIDISDEDIEGVDDDIDRISKSIFPEEVIAESYDLRDGETGFDEIIKALRKEGVESGLFWSDIDWDNVRRLRMINGPAAVLRGMNEREDLGDIAEPNSELVVEYANGEHKLLLFNPLHPRPIKEQVYLRRWVSMRSNEQALRATAALAIGYTVISLLLI